MTKSKKVQNLVFYGIQKVNYIILSLILSHMRNIRILAQVVLKISSSQGFSISMKVWSGGAMVLGKLPISIIVGQAYCACSRCGWGVV